MMKSTLQAGVASPLNESHMSMGKLGRPKKLSSSPAGKLKRSKSQGGESDVHQHLQLQQQAQAQLQFDLQQNILGSEESDNLNLASDDEPKKVWTEKSVFIGCVNVSSRKRVFTARPNAPTSSAKSAGKQSPPSGVAARTATIRKALLKHLSFLKKKNFFFPSKAVQCLWHSVRQAEKGRLSSPGNDGASAPKAVHDIDVR